MFVFMKHSKAKNPSTTFLVRVIVLKPETREEEGVLFPKFLRGIFAH